MKKFRAVAEDNGEEIVIDVHQHWIKAGTFEDPSATIPGLKSLRRRDTGGAVNRLSEYRFQEVASGRIFRSDLPLPD